MPDVQNLDQAHDYESWYRKYPYVFLSEIEAIRELLSRNNHKKGIEICLRTGMFAETLGIAEGIEPLEDMRTLAIEKGIAVLDAQPEKLPYKRNRYDYVLAAHVSAITDMHRAIRECKRVLKPGGIIVIAFINKNSYLGRLYQAVAPAKSSKNRERYYSVERIINEIRRTGFKNIKILQTLFRDPSNINAIERPRYGYSDGSYIVVRAVKR